MKKIICALMALAMLSMLVMPVFTLAEETATPEIPVEPFTWQYLVTIAGAAAFTLLVVQFLKAPLDKVWKIPTRVFAYIIALVVMLVATAFTSGLTVDSVLLVAANAFLAAMSAYGAYELTFAKLNK